MQHRVGDLLVQAACAEGESGEKRIRRASWGRRGSRGFRRGHAPTYSVVFGFAMRQPEPSLRRSVWRAERALGCSRTTRFFSPFGSSGVSVNRDRTKLTPETDFAVERPPSFLREFPRAPRSTRKLLSRAPLPPARRHISQHGYVCPQVRALLVTWRRGISRARETRASLPAPSSPRGVAAPHLSRTDVQEDRRESL